MKKLVSFLFRNWPFLHLLFCAVVVCYVVTNWSELPTVRLLALLNLAALYVHQFEEYVFPGGFPVIYNLVFNQSQQPDRYPLNALCALLINTVFALPVYMLPAFLSDATWYVAVSIIANFAQLVMHCGPLTVKMRSWYSPGCFSLIFLHLPVSIWFIYHTATTGMMTTSDWLFAALMTFVIFVAAIILPNSLLADKQTRYPFTPAEMSRFDVLGKVRRRNIPTTQKSPRGPMRLLKQLEYWAHPGNKE